MTNPEITVRYLRLHPSAKPPHYGSNGAAGADLYAVTENQRVSVHPRETCYIHTGLAVEIPVGFVGLIFARSGIACKRGLAPANKVGVIDSDYRGEIIVALYNQSGEIQTIEDGERIAQLVIVPFYSAVFTESDSLQDSSRGTGGFGSTGK